MAATKITTLEYQGLSLTLVFYPDAFPKMARAIQAMNQRGNVEWIVLMAMLIDALASWDLTDGDQRMPISMYTLSRLPLALVVKMLEHIAQESKKYSQ